MKPQINAPAMEDKHLCLRALTARELMTRNPLSIRDTATPFEAANFFNDHHVSAAPVIDERGKPIGVLSLSDLVWYQRAKGGIFESPHEFYQAIEACLALRNKPHALTIQDIMTPAVFAVSPETPLQDVVQEMHASKVHRLFVVDKFGALVGVITSFDFVIALATGQ